MKLSALDIYAIGDTIQMAGAVYASRDHLFLCMFPGEISGTLAIDDKPIAYTQDDKRILKVLDMSTDDWKKFLFQTDVLEKEIIAKSSDGTLAKAIVRKSQRLVDNIMQWKVFKRDGYACRYCGKDDVPLTVDHLVLWEEGGPSVPENLNSCCKRDNKIRGNLPYEDWLTHPHYVQVSRNLRPDVFEANRALVATLAAIPRYVSARSR